MTIMTLILGETGSGKTTSIRNLPPSETFIINVIDKPLPFKNFKQNYNIENKDGKKPNYYSSDKAANIVSAISKISRERTDIKYLIIDDFGYLMSNEFFQRASEGGYSKFSEIGQHAWMVLNQIKNSRSDLNCIVIAHNELTQDGKYKIKTIGKMLDEKYTVEGVFPHVFHARVIDGKYKFQTRNDGVYIARNPLDMFSDDFIENDMLKIVKVYSDFYGDNVTRESTPNTERTLVTHVTQVDTLNFLLTELNKDEPYIQKVLRKYNANEIQDLNPVVIDHWITSLQKEVNMRND